jgi:DNA-binding response OmpR family regulator
MTEEIRRKKKICIVEDDDDIREIYSVKLLSEGYDVVTATNGEEGMYIINETRPDLILLDLMMPIKNGFEVLDELADNEELSSIPIIIFTNADDENSTKKVGKFDTRFYAIKALTTPQKLIGFVREVLH